MKDQLYAVPQSRVGDFTFDSAVARVFPDMIRRSVPGYAALLDMIGLLAQGWLRPGARCYDLGCSLGAVSFTLARSCVGTGLEIIAADNSPDMIRRLEQRLARHPPGCDIHPVCIDIRELSIQVANLVVLNLTLQFIPPDQRLALLQRIRDGMVPGGLLVLSEKIRFEDTGEQLRVQELHESFKRAMGYSDLEISQKRTALERVLLPDTEAEHLQRLRRCGFGEALLWYRCLNFASFLAWA